ncbi:MAG: SIS domain-containing protein [Nanoarchaeota archaeon]|nr:SIS domain-containing protein [Nanoarchaeota archaeon]
MKNIEVMNSFTTKNLPNLDTAVLAALELFSQTKLPKLSTSYKKPLVVGSGNAAATGKIIFQDKEATFSTESNYESKLSRCDGVVLISASGSKHAPIIAQKAHSKNKKVTLITNTQNSPASKFSDKIIILPKNREPYTYNTSTYLGMILAHTQENPTKILNHIQKNTAKLKFPNFKKYKGYYLLIPEEFSEIIRLLQIKFIELFGRNIARDIETFEQTKHATTVVPAKDELFISFGKKNKTYGKNRFHIPLPKNSDYATMMSIGYYIIGQIQKSQPHWFKQNIETYTKQASKIFKHKINPIVE